jgi:hypothetical protein
VIVELTERPSVDLMEGLRALLRHDSITCAISDCMGRFNAPATGASSPADGIDHLGTRITDGGCHAWFKISSEGR